MKTEDRTQFRSERVRWSVGALMGRLVWHLDQSLLHIELPEDAEPVAH